MKKNQCKCGKNQKITCATCSAVKMVILLKTGNNELKYKNGNNSYANPVWYSPIAMNGKPIQLIIDSMYNRFQKSVYNAVTNKVMFYDNFTKDIIVSI